MIVWSGKGFLSILVLILTVVLMAMMLPKGQSDLALGLSFLVTAVFSWFMGKKWNGAEGKTMIDKASGQEVLIKPHHSLFWIKLQYWGIIFGIIGILFISQAFV